MKAKLTGKWALVTGSSRGIGRQIALGLARQNCNVIIHGRKTSSTDKTLRLLADYSVETRVVSGDLETQPENTGGGAAYRPDPAFSTNGILDPAQVAGPGTIDGSVELLFNKVGPLLINTGPDFVDEQNATLNFVVPPSGGTFR